MSEDKFKFGSMIKALEKAKSDLPGALGRTGQYYFQQNFDKQQWDGVRWDARKSGSTGLDKKVNKKGRTVIEGKALLVANGTLRGSIVNSYRPKESNFKQVVWGSDVKYAKYHNDGFDGEVKAYTKKKKTKKGKAIEVKAHHMKLPRRRFLGGTKELDAKFLKTIKKTFDKVVSGK